MLQRDSMLDLVLRPSIRSTTPVTVRAFLVQAGQGDARAWSPPLQRSADGAVRVAGTAGALGIGAGSWEVVFAIGSADAVPDDPRVVAAALGAPSGGRSWQLLSARVTVSGD